MSCPICSASSSRGERAVTLFELLLVLLILSIVLGLIGAMTIRVNRDYSLQEQAMRAEESARTALDTLTRLIRMAGNDPRDLSFQGVDPDPDGNQQWDSIRLRSDWNPPDGAPVADPAAQSGSIVHINIRAQAHIQDSPSLEFSSSAVIRTREP